MQNVNSFFEMNNGQHNVEPNETHNAIVHMVDHIINSAIYLYNPVTDNTIVHINKQGTKNDPLIGYFTIDSVNSINLFLDNKHIGAFNEITFIEYLEQQF